MYLIRKRLEISGAHTLNLGYDSKSKKIHGHNWIIYVELKTRVLNPVGMVVDFAFLKGTIEHLDHADLNDFIPQPTAENIAKYIFDRITQALAMTDKEGKAIDKRKKADRPKVVRVWVIESEGNEACYSQ